MNHNQISKLCKECFVEEEVVSNVHDLELKEYEKLIYNFSRIFSRKGFYMDSEIKIIFKKALRSNSIIAFFEEL